MLHDTWKYRLVSLSLGSSLLLALMAGCESNTEEGEATDVEVSVEQDVPETEEGASLYTSSNMVNFGLVDPGTRVLKDIRIGNDGPERIVLESIALEGDASITMEPYTTGPLELEPGQFFILTMSFAPDHDVTASAQLRLGSSDPMAPEMTVSLVGECMTPLMEVYPPVVDFRENLIDCPTSRELAIVNEGREELIVTELTLEAIDNPDLELSFDGVLPLTIEPGGTLSATVTYTPSDTESDATRLVILSNDPREEAGQLDVTGKGREPTEVHQTYTTGTMREVDVLVVVDNSGSMCGEQEILRENLLEFMDIVDSQNVPYHIGVIDVEDILLEGNPEYITPETPDRAEAFFENAYRGCDGWQNQEMGLAMSTRAMYFQKYLNFSDFYRQDSALRVLYISDEEDQSYLAVETYVKLLQWLKDDPDDTVLTAIAGDPGTGCSSATSSAEHGDRYNQAAQMTGGGFESICEPDFIEVVEDMAWDSVIEFTDTYPLDSRPSPETLVVTIDGKEIPEDEMNGWTYDDYAQVIIFHGEFVPTYLAQVDITYLENAVCRAELQAEEGERDGTVTR